MEELSGVPYKKGDENGKKCGRPERICPGRFGNSLDSGRMPVIRSGVLSSVAAYMASSIKIKTPFKSINS